MEDFDLISNSVKDILSRENILDNTLMLINGKN